MSTTEETKAAETSTEEVQDTRKISPLACIADDVKIGQGTRVSPFTNLYGCTIGEDCMIGAMVEIQRDVTVGDRSRVQSHTFMCSGITVEEDVFIGHGVMFVNDRHPTVEATLAGTWTQEDTVLKKGCSIGTGAIIFGGLTIGENAVIGAGAVVLKSVGDNETVVGVPARLVGGKKSAEE